MCVAHIIDDRTVQRQSIMGVSSVDNEESLEEDVIAGMRHTYIFGINLCPRRKVSKLTIDP